MDVQLRPFKFAKMKSHDPPVAVALMFLSFFAGVSSWSLPDLLISGPTPECMMGGALVIFKQSHFRSCGAVPGTVSHCSHKDGM